MKFKYDLYFAKHNHFASAFYHMWPKLFNCFMKLSMIYTLQSKIILYHNKFYAFPIYINAVRPGEA